MPIGFARIGGLFIHKSNLTFLKCNSYRGIARNLVALRTDVSVIDKHSEIEKQCNQPLPVFIIFRDDFSPYSIRVNQIRSEFKISA
ncbi:unnamed protein product [Pieris brassicae]|uniref:Uncharacterized protein n=1 Tax=Pieris brassicae TaxID=7116 RepID=A0A9P0TRV9_PIEBR|nr:unnamed protein product [Pieris brassicae]